MLFWWIFKTLDVTVTNRKRNSKRKRLFKFLFIRSHNFYLTRGDILFGCGPNNKLPTDFNDWRPARKIQSPYFLKTPSRSWIHSHFALVMGGYKLKISNTNGQQCILLAMVILVLENRWEIKERKAEFIYRIAE